MVTTKRFRQADPVPAVPVAVKAEEVKGVTGSSSNSTRGTSERARPAGFTPTALVAFKAEKMRTSVPSSAESLLSESGSESELDAGAAAETEVVISA